MSSLDYTSLLPKHLLNPTPDYYLSKNYVVVDFETTRTDYGDPTVPENKVVCVSWMVNKPDKERPVLKYRYCNEYELKELIDDIHAADFVVAHNTKFEMGWLRRAGLDIQNTLWYCTMLGEHVRRGNRTFLRVSLNECLKRYGLEPKLDVVSVLWGDGVNTDEIPEFILKPYCMTDVMQTDKLFKEQRQLLVNTNRLQVALTRNIMTPALAEAESNGMCLDAEAVEHEYTTRTKKLNELRAEMDAVTGGINPRSPKQVGAFLYEVLGFTPPKVKGEYKYRTDKETLANLKPRNKRQHQFLALKKELASAEAAMSKTIAPLFKCVEEAREAGHAPVMRFKFSQATAKTHRLSSKGMEYGAQGQNIPRKFKRLFTSRYPGWKVGEGDGAQLEFRVAAFLGQDHQAMSDIANGEDIHAYTAAVLFGQKRFQMGIPEAFEFIRTHKDKDKSAKEARQDAKPFTFRPLYGGGDNEETGGVYDKDLRKWVGGYCEAFTKKYHELTEEQDRWIDEVISTGKLVLPWGMTYFWPDTRLMPDGYVTNSTNIKNYPVQGLATAEIIPIAVAYFYTYLKNAELQSFMTNTIHDSALTEVHPEEREQVEEMYHQAFVADVYRYLDVVYNMEFNVPLDAEVEFSNNWSVADEETKQAA